MSDILDRLKAYRDGTPTIPFEVPEWGLSAYVRPISANHHANIAKAEKGHNARMAARMIMACVVDEKGDQVFKDDAPTMAELVAQPSPLIARIGQDIIRALGMGDDDPDAAKNS